MTSGTGPLSPDFNGIDPDLMKTFITALEHGRDVIAEQSERIRQLLTAAEVPATALRQVKEIEGWAGDELPRLRQRLQTIDQDLPMLAGTLGLPKQVMEWTDDWLKDPVSWGLLPYDEKTGRSSAGDSAKKGTTLAHELSQLPPSSLGLPDAAYDRVLDALADGQHDPYLTAGFFRVLGPKGVLGMIQRLERYDPKTAAERRKVIGDALGTAIGAQPGVLGSKWKTTALKETSDGELATLLQYGAFPTAWLTQLVRGKVGEPGEEGGDSTLPRRWKTGLVPFLPALANNPDVARELFNAMPQWKLRDLFTELNRTKTPLPFKRPAGMTFDVGAEFGRMLAAAGGAYDQGSHSPEAAKFAFTTMLIMGDLRDTDGTTDSPGTPMEVTPTARIFMSELAGAYAPEIVEGANIGDANMTGPSSLGSSTSAFGTTAAFTLSPKDTYRFLKTFADSPENLTPFDKGMGSFSQRVIADAAATVRRTGDTKRLDDVFTALGNARGFELAAIEKVQGNLDTIDKQNKDTRNFFRDAGIGLVSLYAAPTRAMEYAWYALSTSLSAEGAFGEEDETRMDRVNKAEAVETLGRQHTYAQVLMANGFTPTISPADFQSVHPFDVPIADTHGNLRPFSDLIKEGNRGLEAFEKWVVANGMGSKDDLSLGMLSNRFADSFESRNKRGRERALLFSD
ncbi:DUF6571 family protein [Streptosporangium saharense]|uniref:DUF6571 family protein n=1 Tax=Streptosporangium saharense TaxID=1706840 RepID=UPI003689B60E